MSNHLQFGVLLLAAASLASATDQRALATPEQSFGLSCVVCHSTPRDALLVNGAPEALPTFTVEAGETVQLSFDVYREAGVFEEFEYILGASGLDLPGLSPSLGSDWEYRSGETFPYVLNDEYEDPRTFTLDVAVDFSMPAGLYLMEAIVAGEDEHEGENHLSWLSNSWGKSSQTKVKWSDSQPFYLRVTSQAVPEPSTLVLLVSLVVGLSLKRNPRP